MGLRETIQIAHTTLESVNVPHALIGGVALGVHKVDRATRDVDLLIDGTKSTAAKSALLKIGFQIQNETPEVIQLKKDGTGYLDLLLANRPMSHEMLTQAQWIPSIGMKCVTIEGIIGLKIQAYVNNPKRELQDQADIQALIQTGVRLDWNKIKSYADLFGQWDTIQSIRKTAGA